MNKSIFLLSSLTLTSTGLFAQDDLQVFFIDRDVTYFQEGPSTLNLTPFDEPYYFTAGAELPTGLISSLSLSAPNTSVTIPQKNSNEWEFETGFDSAFALADNAPAGTYTFSGTGQIGDFSLNLQVATALPEPRTFTNFNSLRDVDPTKPITVEFLPLNVPEGTDVILEVEVSYYVEETQSSIELWSAPDERSDGLPGIDPTRTSITLPANLLQGSAFNSYDIFVRHSVLNQLAEAPAPFTDTMLATLQSATTFMQITTQQPTNPSWANYPWLTNDGWINT